MVAGRRAKLLSLDAGLPPGALRELLDACRSTVRDHGWDSVITALEEAAAGRSKASDSILSGTVAAGAALATSGWAPLLAPLVAGLVTTVTPPRETTFADAGPVYEGIEIPPAKGANGPLAQARQRRMLAILGSAQAVGVAASLSGGKARNQGFATGMMLPGAGFLYTRDPARFALTAVAFAFSLLLWFGTGNMVLPPVVWIGAAAYAARRASRSKRTWRRAALAVAGATALTALEVGRHRRRSFTHQVAKAEAANAFLGQASRPLEGAKRPDVHVADELDDEELALTRRFVDMANQAPDDWSNWNVIDQFQPAALRYQINAVIDALALQQYTRVPAFKGYLEDAQRQLITRYLEKKVWGYWALENLWGNLEWDPDPAKRQNIMMTGYFAQSLGLYQTVSGDLQHSEPGSLMFTWNDQRRYPLSYGALCASLAADYVRSPWGLVVCEPNWIFSLCNMRGGTGLRLHDRLHGTTYWDQIGDRYRRGFQQELVRPDGMVNGHRSSRVGIGAAGLTLSADLRNLVPNVADRGFLLLQAACRTPEGEIATPFRTDDRLLDPGNYTFNPLAGYAMVMEEAREAGDEELSLGVYRELRERLDISIDNRGWLVAEGASILAHAGLGRALFGRHGGWLDIVEKGMPAIWQEGPVIDSVPYPQVMVARAVSPNGRDLDAVLRTVGRQERVTVTFARLRPGGRYKLTGALEEAVVADEAGRARVQVEVAGRSALALAFQNGDENR